MFKHLKKIENLIVLLAAVSAVAIVFYKFVPRELTIRPGGDWKTSTADDRSIGGNSIATDLSSDSHFSFSYDIRPGKDSPFTALLIEPIEERLFDLRWMESVSITAHKEGPGSGNFRLQLRNHDEKFYIPGDKVSLRYNEVCLKLTNHPTTQTIFLDKFHVPTWWIERMSVPVEDSKTTVDNIQWIELNTSKLTNEGECRMIVSEVKFSGRWISASVFYKSMLGMWLGFGSLVALSQIIGLRKSLMKSKSMEMSLQRQASELTQLATHDPLTQLYNRRGMRAHVTAAMKELRQAENAISLIMFDIDNFKTLNDRHGHSHGDDVLQKVAWEVKENLTENIALSRWGGEEFLMICKGYKLDRASELAQQLREKVEEEVKVTCSFGVCEVSPESEFSEALDLVDDCLYQAKNAGKNCVKIAASSIQANRKNQTDLGDQTDRGNEPTSNKSALIEDSVSR